MTLAHWHQPTRSAQHGPFWWHYASQRTSYTKRRKQIWEALHPEIQVAQHEPPEFKQTGYKQPPPQTQGFAAATAESTGQSKATTNRAIARAEALGDDTLNKVTNTSLDSGVELDALAKMALILCGSHQFEQKVAFLN